MKTKKPACCATEECEDHFIERMDGMFDLTTTIDAISRSLSAKNRVLFDTLPLREKQWLALQAHDDKLVTYTRVVSRKGSEK